MIRMRWLLAVAVVAMSLLRPYALHAADTKMVDDFEDDAGLKLWDFNGAHALTTDHATSGQHALKIDTGSGLSSWQLPHDWSAYDSLDIDIFVDGDQPVTLALLVGDVPGAKGGYWDRHNGNYNLLPGQNTVEIPVNGLYRGEAGSRNNHLKSNIDPKQINRIAINFSGKGKPVALYIDNMRLVKESRPAGILAFDFGPASQSVFPGFTPITWNTVYGEKGNTAGLSRAASPGRARDDTFPTRLYEDYVEMADGSLQFICNLPDGTYHVWVVYDDCGYWGGETCHHHRRSIDADGVEKYVDDRGEAGPADYLFRFENLEPVPGQSLWDLYMTKLFSPVEFTADAKNGALRLGFHSDAPFSSKIAAIIVYPDANKALDEKWVREVEARNKKEFDTRAIFLGPKQGPLEVPAAAQAQGYWLGYPTLEQDVEMVDPPGPATGELKRQAALGERVSMTFAVRPLTDPGATPVTLTATDLTGPGGTIPAAAVDLRYVHFAAKRTFGTLAYRIVPDSLRRVAGANLALKKDFTRQFWITVAVPPDAKPGTYTGTVTLSAGAIEVKLPLTVTVLGIALDDPTFDVGLFGLNVPQELPPARRAGALKELLTLLKDNGLNSFSGGPGIPFHGFDAAGNPQLDFSACDAFFKVVRACGFTHTIYSYGGPGMVEDIMEEKWQHDSGKSAGEVVKSVWTAVLAHAKANDWPRIAYCFCDEPRTLEIAQSVVANMKIYQDNIPALYRGGDYSVNWGNDPMAKASQAIFHALNFSLLNAHTQQDFDAAQKQGSDLCIYNQGTSRYSFGEYQWAEFHKGAKGRLEWHLLALSGYQFFDLDGREPDFAYINWGKDEIIPMLTLARCRAGCDDLRFAVTLWNRAQKNPDAPAAQTALAFLNGISQKIPAGDRERPAGLPDDETFRAKCIELLKQLP
ncbi:MAG: hypothetical protein ACREJ2_02320 [Planctomycetota bacterium]